MHEVSRTFSLGPIRFLNQSFICNELQLSRLKIYTDFLEEEQKDILMHMTASLESISTKFRPIFCVRGRWVGTVTPRKQTNVEDGEASVEKEKAEPIVAFSKPPSFPPVLGPLVALSILESWNKGDNNDD